MALHSESVNENMETQTVDKDGDPEEDGDVLPIFDHYFPASGSGHWDMVSRIKLCLGMQPHVR